MTQREISSAELPNFINGKLFIQKGDSVRVENNKIVDGTPTHKVSTVWGNGLGSFDGLSVIEIGSLKLSLIKF